MWTEWKRAGGNFVCGGGGHSDVLYVHRRLDYTGVCVCPNSANEDLLHYM